MVLDTYPSLQQLTNAEIGDFPPPQQKPPGFAIVPFIALTRVFLSI